MIKKYIIGIAIVFALLLLFGLFEGTITGRFVSDKMTVIYLPKSADFTNPDHGGVVFEFSFPEESFIVNGEEADFLIFLDSEVIPGLKVGYSVQENKVYGGLPLMSSYEVKVLDNKKHRVVYVFDRAQKGQALIVDGVTVAESEFSGETEKNLLTGYSIFERGNIYNLDIPIEGDSFE